MSGWLPASAWMQEPHTPHASSSVGRRQFQRAARLSAAVRFPTPSGPTKRAAGGSGLRLSSDNTPELPQIWLTLINGEYSSQILALEDRPLFNQLAQGAEN